MLAISNKIKAGDLYASYVKWCEDCGYDWLPNNKFGEQLKSHGIKSKRTGGGMEYMLENVPTLPTLPTLTALPTDSTYTATTPILPGSIANDVGSVGTFTQQMPTTDNRQVPVDLVEFYDNEPNAVKSQSDLEQKYSIKEIENFIENGWLDRLNDDYIALIW